MDVGFDTIGNATVICYDRGPVLVTDPWVQGSAYFGSWALSHEIPEEQMEAVREARYVWFSHGHPDHLNADSLALFKGKKILLADHEGSRIADELRADGYDVTVMKDRTWYPLSDRVRALSIADFNQDAILLVDVNGRLVVNLNDASNTGWGHFVRKVIRDYPVSFLLALSGYGDADMINLYREDGTPILPDAAQRNPVGRQISLRLERFGARYFVPFSSMHRYQRADSVWASQYTTHLEDYAAGFDSKHGELLPAFVRYDCERDELLPLRPRESEAIVYQPEEFGDNWSDPLERDEAARVATYFRSFEHLGTFLDFVNLRVGGVDNVVDVGRRRFNRGITFEAPRNSLMTAVDYGVFDDLLIGNFMKTTFHGDWKRPSLYPDFTPYVCKYGDNGKVKTSKELQKYFRSYFARAKVDAARYYLFDNVRGRLEESARDVFRAFVPMDSKWYATTKRVVRRFVKPALQ